MSKIYFQEKRYHEALRHIQEAVEIFEATGSRYLAEAKESLQEMKGEMG
jgi:tetratricopeptide (TPR) repeat protein